MLEKIFTTVKYILVSVNFLFLITGIIVISVGSSVQAAFNAYHQFLSERFFSLPAFCIATGIIIFLIAFAGFYGAYMENYWMNMTYVAAMVLIFIFQLSACIAGYTLRGNTQALVSHQLTNTMDLYGQEGNYEVTKLWDEVQRGFECCGVTNASDWISHVNTTVVNGVPLSCCRTPVGSFELNCTTTTAFTTGCGPAFGSWVQSHAGSIGIAGVFLVLMQGAAMGGALWMAKITREQNSYP